MQKKLKKKKVKKKKASPKSKAAKKSLKKDPSAEFLRSFGRNRADQKQIAEAK